MLTAQVGFSVAVLFLASLLLLSFRKLITVDLGFNRDNVVLFDLTARDPRNRHPETGAKLLENIRTLPAVEAASLTAQRPMGGDMVWIMTPTIHFPGRENEQLRPREIPVSDGFFNAMQIRWISGRDFLPEEIARQADSAIVNQAFVDTYLHGSNPIGRVFERTSDDPKPARLQIIGVVGTIHYNNLREPDLPTIYTPLHDARGATLNVRAGSMSAAFMAWLRTQTETIAPTPKVRNSTFLSSQIDNTMLRERLLALLSTFFAAVALLLAAVGLYGVISYAAVRRTHEMRIRIALGAPRSSVVSLLISSTTVPVIVGIALGVFTGGVLARYLGSQLFGVRPSELTSLVVPITAILIAAIAATLPPALRTARADPLVALRHG